MTLLDAIGKANEIRPNAIDESLKASWVFEVEAEVAELMEVAMPENKYPNDVELLMPSPFDNIYHLYLCAMIDSVIEDTELYVNDMTISNNARSNAFKWWRRHNMKSCPQYIRSFPWQSKKAGNGKSYGEGVSSVNGMTGDVELTAKDIPFEGSGMSSTNVEGGIVEAFTKKGTNAITLTRAEYAAHKDYYDSLDAFIIIKTGEE